MAFKDNNVASAIPKKNKFQVGRSNIDPGVIVEKDILLPIPADARVSWVYYDCTIGVMLDSGIVVHNRLPQVNKSPDTLASCLIDDPKLDTLTVNGVNLTCQDQYADIVQRMGHSRYWFRLWGQALRIGYQVPIPSIKMIGGVAAIPYDKNPQWGFNRIAPNGNYGGVILWHAQWSLWYTTVIPPANNDIPAVDPSAHIDGDTKLPKGMQAPYSQPDSNAQRVAPTPRIVLGQ